MEPLKPLKKLLNGDEPFEYHGFSIGITMQDFWQYQFSNIYDIQEHIAEFLVAKALGIAKPYNRSGWTPYDILYKGKVRIEVKETGYYYSWQPKGKTSKRRSFSIANAQCKDDKDNIIMKRQSDIYVFCLNTGEKEKESNPLELEHWEFYVVPTDVINARCGNNLTISLGKVAQLATKATSFENLKEDIDKAICQLSI